MKLILIHSQGQGSRGLTTVSGEPIIKDASQPIEQSGSQLQIDNGSFTIQVQDESTGKTQSYNVDVRQQGLSTDTTVNDLIAQINNIQASKQPFPRWPITDQSGFERHPILFCQ